MNIVILIGRLVKDPEVKTTQSQIAVCAFTIAVDRKFKAADGSKQADFINCVAWRQQAEFLGKYFQKGSRLGLTGNLQSRSYDDVNGKKVYVTEVIIDEIEFVESKREGGQSNDNWKPSESQSAPTADNGFYPAMDDDTTLPFDL